MDTLDADTAERIDAYWRAGIICRSGKFTCATTHC